MLRNSTYSDKSRLISFPIPLSRQATSGSPVGFNNGSGGFTAHTISTNAGYSVFAADVDGDGDLDVLSVTFTANKIAWYENDGNGAYTKYLGPIRWSFDYAGVHFVGLDWAREVAGTIQTGVAPSAVRWLARAACEATERKQPGYLDTLAAAQARVGRYEEAIATVDVAIRLSIAGNKWGIVNSMKQRRAMYAAKQAFPSP